RVGLVPQSYVPPTAIQELRSLTRTRTHLIAERTQHKNRIHNILQQGNIKLTGVLSDIYGKTGRKDRKSTRLNSSHVSISYAVFCLKKKNKRRFSYGTFDDKSA